MNRIKLIGQAITSTNYTTKRLFNFNPEPIRDMAQNFLASGITEVEIPQGVLDPENKFPEICLDEETLKKTISLIPKDLKVLGTYFGTPNIHADLEGSIKATRRRIDHFIQYFPDFSYAMIHPLGKAADAGKIKEFMDFWAECSIYAASKKPGVQFCLHNHYDGCCESADQVRCHLEALQQINLPSFPWGVDTGHCHGMGDAYLSIFAEYAHLIGNHFHIKARIPAFDQLHGGDQYCRDRDIWGNDAEVGRGLYSGFVCAADPEVETPFKEIFQIIREKAKPTNGVVTGAMEVDIPRQHPRLEIMCGTLYLTRVHGLETGQNLSCDQIVERVFKK